MPEARLTRTQRAVLLNRQIQPRVAEAIRERAATGESVANLAADFGLSRSVIRRIVLTGETQRTGDEPI